MDSSPVTREQHEQYEHGEDNQGERTHKVCSLRHSVIGCVDLFLRRFWPS